MVVGKNNVLSGTLFIIAAPTGAGKTTLVNLLTQRNPELKKVITYTTRAPRRGEQHRVDYHFVTQEEFLALKEANFFLETTVYDQCWYGSPSDIVADVKNGAKYIIITDWPGAQTIAHELTSNHSTVPFKTLWITVPSEEILRQRLIDRCKHDLVLLERRLALFKQELDRENEIRFFKHHIVNDDLEETYQNLLKAMELF